MQSRQKIKVRVCKDAREKVVGAKVARVVGDN